MNLVTFLTAQSGDRPGAPAIIDRHRGRVRITTFGELDRRSQEGAAFLRACGLRAGDRILFLHPMSVELYVALVSAWRAGMVAVFIDISAGRRDLEACCARARPAAFAAGAKAHLLRIVSPAVRRIPRHVSLGGRIPGAADWSRAAAMPCDPAIADADDATPALLTLTSGSTGLPKAAVRTHGFLRAQYRALQEVLRLAPGEVDLTTLPMVALANLASGVTSVIPHADLRRPGAIAPAPVLEQIARHHITRAAGSPALLDRLADHCLGSGRTLPELQRIFTGGGPVFPGLLDRLQRVAPNADVSAVYGSSEAEPVAHVSNAQISEEDRRQMAAGRGLLAGAPVASVQLRILDECASVPARPLAPREFADLCLPQGSIGEVAVTGEHVLRGYLDGEGDAGTKLRVLETVWHRTGDAGRLDDQGRLWLLGRSAAAVRDRRGVVYPFAVECAAQQQPNVRRAALVPMDGQRTLVVERRDWRLPLNVAALRASLAWAGIDDVRECARLPVDHRHNAKIDYRAVQQLIDRTTAPSGG